MELWNLRSLLVAVIFLCNCISWTASRHHFKHHVLGHRSRHRRQGAGLFLPASYVIPGGEGAGAWGDWGEVSPCSRTCGGGVASQKRICLQFSQDGRPLCTGGDTKYFSCQTQDCPPDEPDFRAQQCSAYDNQPFRGTTYSKWVPYTKAPNPCQLNCMPQNERFFYRHKEQVIDGTRCNDMSFDVCVAGVCQPVGCDMMLGSTAREDRCRQCRGNGTNCHTASGVIDTQDLRKGYNDILLIPEGATSIYIGEMKESNNYLALRAKQSNVYYLNGNYHIDFPRGLTIAGALWHYDRDQQGLASPDKLRCLGPTTEPLYLSLLLMDENVGIEYEYSIPSSRAPPPNQQYNWVHEEFTPCSAKCGEGYQTREVSCRSREELEVVDESLCDEGLKPPTNQSCNTQPCDAKWVEGPWSPCSKPCGQGGSRSRQVHCERIVRQGLPSIVPDKECFDHLGPKPELFQECNKDAKCPTWFTGPWKPCDKLCGEGKQTRQVVCHQRTAGRVEVLSDEACTDEKPSSEQPCMLHPCEGVDWVLSDWSGCDNCLSKVRTRVAECATKDHQVVNATLCGYHPTVVLEEPCDQTKLPPCTVQWYATQWSNCSVECGKGVQQRRVFCGLFNGESVIKVDNIRCENETKYKDTKPCEVPTEKCPAKWFAGKWTECTKTCGGGEQFRRVMCLRGGKEVSNCDGEAVLESTQSCNESPCDIDETLPVNFTSTTVMDDDADYEDCEEDEEELGEEVGADAETGLDDAFTDEETMFSDSPYTTGEGSGSTSFTEIESEFTVDTGSGSEPTTETLIFEEGSGEEIEDTTGTETGSTEETDSTVTEESVSTVTEEMGSTETGITESTETEEFGSTVTEQTVTESTDETSSTESGSTDATTDSSDSTSKMPKKKLHATSTQAISDTTTEAYFDLYTTTDAPSTFDSTTAYTESSSTTDISETAESSTTEITDSSTETSTSEASTESSTSISEITETTSTETGSFETTESDIVSTTEVGSSTESGSTEATESSSTETTEIGSTEVTETGSTDTTGTGITETSETGSTETTETGSTETAENGSTETSETGITETTETGSTETTFTSGSTETEETGSTESTSESSSTTEEGTGSTPWDWSTTLEIYTKKPKCRPRKKQAKCIKTTFGCCPDNKTAAAGPFDEGCPDFKKTCKETKHGCCLDGVSPAEGPNNKGCPIQPCKETLYGCCKSDKITPAEGNDQEGCPPPPPACKSTKYGCCKDNKTAAKGPKKKGCPETEPKQVDKGCVASEFGCCFDNKTKATGPNEEGCPCDVTEFGCCPDGVAPARGTQMEGCIVSCNTSAYGCCPDNETSAHGPEYEGCCLLYPFGCCPDNFKPAEGPDLEGCGCQYAHYGCCPNQKTIARGPNKEGCGCQYSEHGCCPDKHTEASGPNFEGCGCHTYQFGCCPDGTTISTGPNLQGCLCQQSKYGCCGDDQTAATGPNKEGCDCSTSKYGCCPDGQTEAKGDKFLGCTDIPENRQAACGLPTDRGPCRNYTVYWFYDNEYGGCSRFWYGGCEGNGNKFTSKEECEEICVHPPPKDSCKLPKVKGACTGQEIRWYYDTDRERCEWFQYGGCLGNANNFESRELCASQCEPLRSEDTCTQPIERGSCAGNFRRWGFNAEAGRCEQFIWGGCEGNHNRFGTEAACVQKCDPPGALKSRCTEAQEKGNCTSKVPAWSFSQSENRCVPFYYSGCGGTDNRFDTEDQCSEACPSAYVKDVCALPAITGTCGNYRVKWFYDTTHNQCRQFYYGGCGGNGNNFNTQLECERRCTEAAAATTTTVQPAPQGFNQEYCFLERDSGPCTVMEQQWAYDAALGRCVEFEFGGCGGNSNRFPTIDHCQFYCNISQDICQLPMSQGPCEASLMRWFYDASTDSCSQFTYGGCKGNGNRFESRTDCERRCRNAPEHPPSTTTTVAAPLHPCAQPQEPGNCLGSILSWYYDSSSDQCLEFLYTGCQGNENRFSTRADCEGLCRPQAPAQTTTTVAPYTPVPQPGEPECTTPPSLSPCGENVTAFYYDSATGTCVISDIGGCRYPNSYRTEEECERRCGAFRGIDPCNAQLDPGPCRAAIEKVYFDALTGQCNSFTYGGCHGGANRFSTIEECEEVCGANAPEPSCLLPVSTGGGCGSWSRRWFYDAATGDCAAFVYDGCGGNDNNFVSYELCTKTCIKNGNDLGNEVLPDCDRYNVECAALRCEYSVQRTRTADGCERCSCVQVEVDCRPLAQECENLKCNYGKRKTVGPDGCERCQCTEHPCAALQCEAGKRCTIVSYWTDPATQEPKYTTECRQVNKPGSCPLGTSTLSSDSRCRRECNDDADCADDAKCCSSGCSQLCASPSRDQWPTTPSPEIPQAPQANSAETQPEVTASEGGHATLRCLFHGNPPPKITWRRGEITIDGTVGRYRVTSEGALEIVSLLRSDSGVYICIANNGLGTARQEIRLLVDDPVDSPAGISADNEAEVTGELGQPLTVRCLAYGWPTPSIFWHHGRTGPMVPYSSSEYEARDNTLVIRTLNVESLGEYACQAYNGIGTPATWLVVVRAWRPEGYSYDSPYLVSRQRDKLVVVTPRIPTTVTSTTPEPEPEVPVYTVPVSTKIAIDSNTIAAGSELSLPCEVDGYPFPDVHWTKDGVVFAANDSRTQVTDARLTISAVTTNDSGVYGCHARNAYSAHSSTVSIEVRGIYIPPTCTDNPFFANCHLIVRSNFCRHQYYSEFCCKSCVEAGLLNPWELKTRADRSWEYKKK